MMFWYNPACVPAMMVEDEGRKLCRECFDRRQELRASAGFKADPLHPAAYRGDDTASDIKTREER